jgi:uncharacterized membrane protein
MVISVPSLRLAPLSQRVFASAVLAVLGIGFVLSLVYLWAREIRPHRQQGKKMIETVVHTYHGAPDLPRLISALHGSMAPFVHAEELAAIEAWAEAGAGEDAYKTTVAPIIARKCASCHAEGKYPPTLATYTQAADLARADRGMDLRKLARMTHVHLLGIPLLFYILGALFVRTRYREGLKAVLVVVPFVGILWDISHWWLTRRDPSQALGVIVGSTLMSLGFATQWCMTMWDIWAPFAPGAGARESGPSH